MCSVVVSEGVEVGDVGGEEEKDRSRFEQSLYLSLCGGGGSGGGGRLADQYRR